VLVFFFFFFFLKQILVLPVSNRCGSEERFAVDAKEMETRFRGLQRILHPDLQAGNDDV
jgi:hypothetical protein